MSIGSGSRDELSRVADKIDKKWPGRYDFSIADSSAAEESCRLRVRHRPVPSDEELSKAD
ncbi:MAG: hypothetical protein CMI52_01425 [Parcubacteria group bacterium]|nr:hypothetical protein [Parcubacteria group bacterium]